MCDVTNYMDVYRTEPEYVVTHEDYVPIRVEIAAMGGGELGKSYENNRWIYNVWHGSDIIVSGDDFHTHFAASHYAVAVMILDWVINNAEHTSDTVEMFGDDNHDDLETMMDEISVAEHVAGVASHACNVACDEYVEQPPTFDYDVTAEQRAEDALRTRP